MSIDPIDSLICTLGQKGMLLFDRIKKLGLLGGSVLQRVGFKVSKALSSPENH